MFVHRSSKCGVWVSYILLALSIIISIGFQNQLKRLVFPVPVIRAGVPNVELKPLASYEGPQSLWYPYPFFFFVTCQGYGFYLDCFSSPPTHLGGFFFFFFISLIVEELFFQFSGHSQKKLFYMKLQFWCVCKWRWAQGLLTPPSSSRLSQESLLETQLQVIWLCHTACSCFSCVPCFWRP